MRGANRTAAQLRARENMTLGIDTSILVGAVALACLVLRLMG